MGPASPSGTSASTVPGLGDGGLRCQRFVSRRGHQFHELGQRGGGGRICGLGLLDLDEPAADRHPRLRRVEEVLGGSHHGVGATHVVGGRRKGPRQRDERVVGQQVVQAIEAGPGGGQILLQAVEVGSVDTKAGVLGPHGHRLEVRPEGARIVQCRQVADGGQEAGRDADGQQRDPRPDQDAAAARCGGRAATPATLTGRLGGWRLCGVGLLGHGAGYAMAMKRGEVGW